MSDPLMNKSYFQSLLFSLPLTLSTFASAAPALTGNLVIGSDWGDGYCAKVYLKNTGTSATTTWTTKIDIGSATLRDNFNSTIVGTTGVISVTPVKHNSIIDPGSEKNFGYCANGKSRPTLISTTTPGAAASSKALSSVAPSSIPASSIAPSSVPASSVAPSSRPASSKAASSSSAAAGDKLVHPGIMSTLSDLETMRMNVAKGNQPWANEITRLKAKITRSGIKIHNPNTENDVGGGNYIYCGSFNKTRDGKHTVVACNWPVEDGIDAYTFALLGYLTDNTTYSKKALDYLRSWTNETNFRGFDPEGSNHFLQAGWTIPWYANTAEILRYTYSGWTSSDTIAMQKFLNRLLPQVVKDNDGAPNNWLHSRIEGHIAAAIFLDDKDRLNKAVSRWKEHTRSYIYIDKDRGVPVLPTSSKAAEKGASIWNTPKFVQGLTMETCRDLNHQDLGMRSIFNSLAMATNQKVDLFSGNDNKERLYAFLATQARWAVSKKNNPDGVCDNPIVVQPGDPAKLLGSNFAYESYPIAYKILRSASNPLTVNKEHIELLDPVTASKWVTKWETLTHHVP
jgi:hypothetical protein